MYIENLLINQFYISCEIELFTEFLTLFAVMYIRLINKVFDNKLEI